jgi:hypothetical protein
MAWIELHPELVEHKKLKALMRVTGAGRDACVGRLCILWLWAMSNRPDGDLTDVDAADFARLWELGPRKAAAFRDGLEQCGFLDRREGRLLIHDWEDYAGRLLEARRKHVERSRRYRENRRGACEERDGHGDGQRDGQAAPLPYLTQPNRTQPDLTEPILSDADGSSAARAGEEAEMADYLTERGLNAQTWFGATAELLERNRELTDQIFRVFCTRRPTQADYGRMFPLVTVREDGPQGEIRLRWDEDRASLLRYAFEQAALNGAGGKWNYVDGVLQRLGRRGLRSAWAAEGYDLERE